MGRVSLVYLRDKEAAIKLTVSIDGITSIEQVYAVFEDVQGLVLSVSDADQSTWFALENAVVRHRGAQDWRLVVHAYGSQEALTRVLTDTVPRHPELYGTTIAFEEGRAVTVSRYISGRTEPASTDRYPLEMYDTLEEEFRFHPTDAEALLLLPHDVEAVTLELLQQRFGA